MIEYTGYKIVRCVDGKLLSYSLPPRLATEYVVGEAAKRREGWGPLSVISCLYGAMGFWRVSGGKLFECTYIPSDEGNYYMPLDVLGNRHYPFMIRASNSGIAVCSRHIPFSDYAEKLTLTREIFGLKFVNGEGLPDYVNVE